MKYFFMLRITKPTAFSFFTALILVFSLAHGGWGYIINGNIWNVAILLAGICFLFIFFFSKPKLELVTVTLLAIAAVVLIDNNYLIEERTNVMYIITAVLFSLAACNRDGWLKESIIPLLTFIGLFYSFMTIFSYYVPGFYENIIYPFFASNGATTKYLITWTHACGFTSHYSTNGMMCAMPVCCMIGYLVPRTEKDRSVNKKVLIAILFLIAWIALLLTTKRAHIIFCAAGALVTYYAYNSDKPVSRWFKIATMCIVVLIGFTVIASVFPNLAGFLTRFSEGSDSGDVTNGRIGLWMAAWAAFLEHPLFGNGWYYFYHNYLIITESAHVHNVYIQLLAETGIIGFACFVTFFVISFYRTFKCISSCRKGIIKLQQWHLRLLAISLCYQTFFLLYCVTGTCLYEVNTMFPYFFFCMVGNYLWRLYFRTGYMMEETT